MDELRRLERDLDRKLRAASTASPRTNGPAGRGNSPASTQARTTPRLQRDESRTTDSDDSAADDDSVLLQSQIRSYGATPQVAASLDVSERSQEEIYHVTSELLEAQTRNQSLQREVAQLRGELKRVQDARSDNETSSRSMRVEQLAMQEELDEARDKVSDLEIQLTASRDSYERLQAESRLQQTELKSLRLTSLRVADLQDALDEAALAKQRVEGELDTQRQSNRTQAEKIASLQSQLAAVQAQLESHDARDMDGVRSAHDESLARLRTLADHNHELQAQIDEAQHARSLLEETIHSLKQAKGLLFEQLTGSQRARQEQLDTLERIGQSHSDLVAEARRMADTTAYFEQALGTIGEDVRLVRAQDEAALEALHEQLASVQDVCVRLGSERTEIDAARVRAEAQCEALSARLADAERAAADATSELRDRLAAAHAECDALRARFAEQADTLSNAHAELVHIQDEHVSLASRYRQVEHDAARIRELVLSEHDEATRDMHQLGAALERAERAAAEAAQARKAENEAHLRELSERLAEHNATMDELRQVQQSNNDLREEAAALSVSTLESSKSLQALQRENRQMLSWLNEIAAMQGQLMDENKALKGQRSKLVGFFGTMLNVLRCGDLHEELVVVLESPEPDAFVQRNLVAPLTRLVTASERHAAKVDELQQRVHEMDGLRGERDQLSRDLQAAEVDRRVLTEKLHTARDDLRAVQGERDQLQVQLSQAKAEHDSLVEQQRAATTEYQAHVASLRDAHAEREQQFLKEREALDAAVAALRRELLESTDDARSKADKIETLEHQVERLEIKVQRDGLEKVQRLEAYIDELSAARDALSARSRDMDRRLESYAQYCHELSAMAQEQSAEIARLSEGVTAAVGSMHDAREQLSEERELFETFNMLAHQQAADNRELKRTLAAVQSRKTELQDTISQLEQAQSQLRADLRSLRDDKASLKGEVDESNSARDEARSRADTLRANLHTLTLEKSGLEAKLDTLEERFRVLHETHGKMLEENNQLSGELRAATSARDSLLSQLECAQQDKDLLEKRLGESEERLAALRTSVEEGAVANARLQDEAQQLRSDLGSLTKALAESRETTATVSRERDRLRTELDFARADTSSNNGEGAALGLIESRIRPDIGSLHQEALQYATMLKGLQQKVDAQREEMQAARAKQDEVIASMRKRNRDLIAAVQRKTEDNQAQRRLESLIEQERRQHKDAQQRIAELEGQLQAADRELRQLRRRSVATELGAPAELEPVVRTRTGATRSGPSSATSPSSSSQRVSGLSSVVSPPA